MNKPPGIARTCCLLLALLAASLPAIPQQAPKAYTVEFILFRSDGDHGNEDGSATASLHSTPGDSAVTLLSTRRLATAASKLRNAGGYRILAHVAWSQTPAAWNSRRGVPVSELGLNVPGLS